MMFSDRCQQCRGRQCFSSTSVTIDVDDDDDDDDDDIFRQVPSVSRFAVFHRTHDCAVLLSTTSLFLSRYGLVQRRTGCG